MELYTNSQEAGYTLYDILHAKPINKNNRHIDFTLNGFKAELIIVYYRYDNYYKYNLYLPYSDIQYHLPKFNKNLIFLHIVIPSSLINMINANNYTYQKNVTYYFIAMNSILNELHPDTYVIRNYGNTHKAKLKLNINRKDVNFRDSINNQTTCLINFSDFKSLSLNKYINNHFNYITKNKIGGL